MAAELTLKDIEAIKGEMAPTKVAMNQEREEILRQLREGQIDGKACTLELSRITDKYLVQIADKYLAPVRDSVTLVLGGGNGRQEACPGSDLDLTVLAADLDSEVFLEAYQRFYYAIDIHAAGFPSTGSLRPYDVEQLRGLALKDDPTHNTLLERRHVWGSDALFAQLDQMARDLNPRHVDYVRKRLDVRKERLAKPVHAPHMLEPNIKEGYGGTRDYETLQWIAKVINGGGGTPDLVEYGFLSSEEAQELEEAHDFLLTLRCRLHEYQQRIHRENYLTDHREDPECKKMSEAKTSDVLASRYQEGVAKEMPEFGNAERLMQRYYLATRTIGRLTNITCAAIAEKVMKEHLQADGFAASEQYIRFQSDTLADPIEILKIYQRAQETGYPLHHTAQRVIRRHLHLVTKDTLFERPDMARLFVDVMCGPRSGHYLRQMQELGLLQRLDYNYAGIDSLRQFDANHAYTVDEHSFQCLEKLEDILAGRIDRNQAFAVGLVKKMTESDKRVLYVALYMHDLAKATEPRGKTTHPEVGGLWAVDKCRVLGLNDEETQKVSWLVTNHLRLSTMARYMDGGKRGTVERFLTFLPPESKLEHLNLLAVLTTADVMAGAPGKWNAIKNSQIKKLHGNTADMLTGHEIGAEPALPLPRKYVAGQTVIDIRQDFEGAATVLTVTTPDHPYLFENIVGALSAGGNNILDAQATTHEIEDQRIVVNSIVLQGENGKAISDLAEPLIEKAIEAALKVNGRGDYASSIKAEAKVDKTFPVVPEVEIAQDLSDHETFIKITARDAKGLAYRLARKFNDLNLDIRHQALNADGHQVRNTFYVCTREGQKLPDNRIDEVRASIYECIAE